MNDFYLKILGITFNLMPWILAGVAASKNVEAKDKCFEWTFDLPTVLVESAFGDDEPSQSELVTFLCGEENLFTVNWIQVIGTNDGMKWEEYQNAERKIDRVFSTRD